MAHAERRRVVVLPFEGEKAEKFHEAVVKIVKKSHSVIPVDKYTSTADDLSASKVNEKNVKKVAKKLKLDGVVTGTVEKRRDQYILRIKVRAGKTGDFVGNDIKTTADGPRLDGSAARDLKDELVDLISNLSSNRGGGSDDEEEEDRPKKVVEEEEEEVKPTKKKPAKVEEEVKPTKKKPAVEDDEEEAAALKTKKGGFSKKKFDEDEDRPSKSAKTEEEEEEDSPLPKSKKRPKDSDEEEDTDVASKEDGDGEGDVTEEADPKRKDTAVSLSPGNRAVDFVAGLSFNARRMAFKFDPDLENRPPGYKGVPAPGLLLDGTIYPLAFGHSNKGMIKNLGLTFMYDKVLLINSKDAMGAKLDTKAARYAIGAVFRYPFNKSATSPVIGAQFRYGRQNFTIGGMADIPNVNYTILDPGVFLRFPISAKVVLNVDAAFMLITNTGAIQKTDEYGPATVSGFEGEFGFDYMVTKALFARAAFRFETIGLTFKGGANKSSNRDADEDQDVSGARDSYFGGLATIGYLY
ncbi:MAG: hypothetical protein WKG01_15970 [Kofleriaceae bacterium]